VDEMTTAWCEHCKDRVYTVTHPYLDVEYDYKTFIWGVYDLETKLNAKKDMGIEVNDLRKQGRLGELGLSCLAIWDSERLETDIYGEGEAEEAVERIEGLDCVVDFNGTRFDRRVLEGILGRETYFSRYVDLLRLIWDGMDRQGVAKAGSSLDAVAKSTLGYGKNGKGVEAPELARKGEFGKLHRYCMNDVRITRDLMLFIRSHGWVKNGKGTRIKVELPKWLES
jgi:DEAD/DEAH box helicase domain-containing protein